MQFSFSDASTIQVVQPTAPTRNEKATAAAHKPSRHTIAKAGLKQPAPPAADHIPLSELAQVEPSSESLTESLTEPLTVVKQTINDLEAQGLLMLFDRHDQVAKRLTDDLISAGVLQEGLLIEQPIERPESTPLQLLEEAD